MTLTGNTLAVTLYINNKIIYSEKFIEAISSFWIRYSSFFFQQLVCLQFICESMCWRRWNPSVTSLAIQIGMGACVWKMRRSAISHYQQCLTFLFFYSTCAALSSCNYDFVPQVPIEKLAYHLIFVTITTNDGPVYPETTLLSFFFFF